MRSLKASTFNTLGHFRIETMLYWVFFASGATALIYQVAWMRMFVRIIGSTTIAGTIILAAFFSGMALGAWGLGRLADRFGKPLLLYAILEVVLGVYAAISPWFIDWLGSFHGFFSNPMMSNNPIWLLQFFVLWFVLLIPTTIMGGTLPVVSKVIARRKETLGRTVGRLYAINTFGAVLGTIASSIVLIKIIGLRNVILGAAAVNFAIGVFSYVLYRRHLIESPSAPAPTPPATRDFNSEQVTTSLNRQLLLAVVFFSGFVSLASEVLWLRVFSSTFDSSVQSFGIVLAMVLTGFALGSYIFAKQADRPSSMQWLFGCFIGSSALITLTTLFLDRLPRLYFTMIQSASVDWYKTILVKFALAAFILLPLTLIMGGIFPLALRLYTRQVQNLGRSIGDIYGSNTVGGILGSVTAGLVLLPMLGVRISFLLLAAVFALMGIVLLMSQRRFFKKLALITMTGYAGLFLMAVIFGTWEPERMLIWWGGVSPQKADVLFYREGLETNVAVVRHQDANHLFVGKKVVAADDAAAQRHLGFLSHIPLMLHHNPRNVLVIGLATGITLNAALCYPIESAICVDINPLMLTAAQHFSDANDRILENPRAQVLIADARHFLGSSPRQFDVITTDPIHPADANSNNLYSLEFYRLAAQALEKNGIMCQWLPAADLAPREIRRVIATFSHAFSHVSMWIPNISDLALIGSNDPVCVDLNLIGMRLQEPAIRHVLAKQLDRITLADFLAHFGLGNDALRAWCQKIDLNTDDKPILEYEAPKSLWDPANLPNLYIEIIDRWSTAFSELGDMMIAHGNETLRGEIQDSLAVNHRAIVLQTARSLSDWCLQLESRKEYKNALEQYERIFSLFPETLNPLTLDALVGMSLCYEQLGLFEKALDFYWSATSIASTEVQSRLLTARALVRRSQVPRARIEWQRVLAIDPDNQEARDQLQYWSPQ